MELWFRGTKGDQKRYGDVVSFKKTLLVRVNAVGTVCHSQQNICEGRGRRIWGDARNDYAVSQLGRTLFAYHIRRLTEMDG